MGVGVLRKGHLSLSPPGHTDEELGTVQKSDLTARKGWSESHERARQDCTRRRWHCALLVHRH